MKNSPKVIVCIALAVLFASSVLSFAQEKMHNNPGGAAPAVQSSVSSPTVLFTTTAKVAYFYSRGFAAPRAKGVASFTHPSTGVYCITPSASVALDFRKIEPQVSVEWGTSLGNALLAFWRDTVAGSDCPAGALEVQTFDFNAGGSPVASGRVSFNLVIK